MAIFAAAMWAALSAFSLNGGVPVVENERWQSGVPLGGIGCGAVELMTDGSFDWCVINNNWDRPIRNEMAGAFFALRWARGGQAGVVMLRLRPKKAAADVAYARQVRFSGLFPRAIVELPEAAPGMDVRLEGWSALVPRNPDDSALPAAVFDVEVANRAGPTEAMVMFSWPNVLTLGGDRGTAWGDASRNFQEIWRGRLGEGLIYRTSARPEGRELNAVGEYVVACEKADGVAVEVLRNYDYSAAGEKFWRDVADKGDLKWRGGAVQRPAGIVAARFALARGEKKRVRFVLAWYTPHLVMEHREELGEGGLRESYQDTWLAVDGDMATRWTTGRAMRPGDGFEVELPGAVAVREVILKFGPSPHDWPRGLEVWVREQGRWRRAVRMSEDVCKRSADDGAVEVYLPGAVAEAIRLVQTGRTSYWWWSIHELQVVDAEGREVDLSAAATVAYLREIKYGTRRRDEGHWYERRFSGAGAVAEYVLENARRLRAETLRWQELILKSSLPGWLKAKLINDLFVAYANTVFTRTGKFSVLESPIDMGGALGTMDQRMAAHAAWTQLFPGLDRRELELFAACQREDGRITHFCGNVHEVIGNPEVGYGVTDWPDLSCSFVMQVVKWARWMGDRAWLREMWPHISRAMQWLEGADEDGDLIPEGGSTYDYESLPRGAFVYSASAYLGALLAAAAAAEELGMQRQAEALRRRFEAVQVSVMDLLWNGEFFIKWARPGSDRATENSFVAALAGDWFARLGGYGETLPRPVAEWATEQLLRRHLLPFYPVPPMEVTPRGLLATQACFILQHQPYLGCQAIYRGFTDAGLEVLRRVWLVAWQRNKDPWHQRLSYTAPEGRAGGLRSYMTCPASWHVLNALSGVSLDRLRRKLYVSPRLPSGADELEMPVFLGDAWLWLSWKPGERLRLKVLRSFARAAPVIKKVAAWEGAEEIDLGKGFPLRPGLVLDLTRYEDKLGALAEPKRPGPAVRPPNGIGLEPWRWRVEAEPNPVGFDAAYAVDRQPRTRWSTARDMRGGEQFVIELGRPREVSEIWLDTGGGQQAEDWPRGLCISASDDGRSWRSVARFAAGDVDACRVGTMVRLRLPHPHRAKFWKLTQLGSAEGVWWSIAEIYLLPPR